MHSGAKIILVCTCYLNECSVSIWPYGCEIYVTCSRGTEGFKVHMLTNNAELAPSTAVLTMANSDLLHFFICCFIRSVSKSTWGFHRALLHDQVISRITQLEAPYLCLCSSKQNQTQVPYITTNIG